tara:strand:+ start:713 stop:2242 length:1530 start_codon:yes stop_codon:yes gene_type:complete
MTEVSARKRLFAQTYRRKPYTGAPRPRLLGGQALAQAQRLSHASMRPAVLSVTLFVVDLLIVALAGRVGFALGQTLPLNGAEVWAVSWLGALIVVGVIRALGGYAFRRMRATARGAVIGLAGLVIGLAALKLVLSSAGLRDLAIESWLILWALAATGLIGAVRVFIGLRIRTLTQTGRLEHRIVLVGGGDNLAPMIREIDRERRFGRRMCGFFDERGDRRSPAMVAGYHKMGDVDDLVEFARAAKIDTVIVAIPGASQQRIHDLLARLFVLPVDIRVLEGAEVPGYSRKRRSRIGPFRLIEIYTRPFDGARAVQKRIFDIVFACLAIVLLAPVMVVIAALIKLESRGPVLFVQKRHGFNNKPIQVLKFRSMYSDMCDPTAVKAVRRGDARVTRIGRFIRRASIDELPQFFNVLRGELSLVGPRPHAMAARTGDILYDQVTDAYSARHKVKPGITGWAQINGWRGEMNNPDKIRARIEHDLYYIENWSLWLDFKILMMTPYSLVTTRNAY